MCAKDATVNGKDATISDKYATMSATYATIGAKDATKTRPWRRSAPSTPPISAKNATMSAAETRR